MTWAQICMIILLSVRMLAAIHADGKMRKVDAMAWTVNTLVLCIILYWGGFWA